MKSARPIHPDFAQLLDFKDRALITLFKDARSFILERYPQCNELLYHTHALTAVFSLSDKLGDAFCMLPIYSQHLNFGFNKGALLPDPQRRLSGTGQLIRHVDVQQPADYRHAAVEALLHAAVQLATKDMTKPSKVAGQTISKIKL